MGTQLRGQPHAGTVKDIYAAAEEENVRKATAALQTFLDAYRKGEIGFHDLPPAMRTQVTMIQQDEPVDDQ